MKIRYIAPNRLNSSDDWRASYHLSPAALLPEMGEHWPTLQQMGKQCIEGWRITLKQIPNINNEDIENLPLYKLRHIGSQVLETERDHSLPPAVYGEPFCIQPWDVIIKKVGGIKAALALPEHGQHPADANLAIIRGLSPEQGLWLTQCLEQPLYRNYLESSERITALIRVGIKQLKQMPLNPMPESFKQPARTFIAACRNLAEAHYQLDALRKEVSHWTENWQQGLERFINHQPWQKRWQTFPASDIGDNWLMSYTEQRYLARQCLQEYQGSLLENLAAINPRQPNFSGDENQALALRIRDIDNHFGLSSQPQPLTEMAWRTRARPNQQYDVLVSTFIQHIKVGFIEQTPEREILPSDQLATLAFHQYQGAWALIMETPFIRCQLSRLATGSVQQFVPSAMIRKLVLPPIDREPQTAERWHRLLIKSTSKAARARQQMVELTHPQQPMQQIFEQAHAYQGDWR